MKYFCQILREFTVIKVGSMNVVRWSKRQILNLLKSTTHTKIHSSCLRLFAKMFKLIVISFVIENMVVYKYGRKWDDKSLHGASYNYERSSYS